MVILETCMLMVGSRGGGGGGGKNKCNRLIGVVIAPRGSKLCRVFNIIRRFLFGNLDRQKFRNGKNMVLCLNTHKIAKQF